MAFIEPNPTQATEKAGGKGKVTLHAGATTFCPDGEKHGIENASKTEDLVFMALIIRK